VDEPDRLPDVVAHFDPSANLLGPDLLVLDSDQLPEPVASEQLSLLRHARERSYSTNPPVRTFSSKRAKLSRRAHQLRTLST
jgi:hypothetical protein